MVDIATLQVGGALLGGGAAGAIITALVTSYRNRVQPVGYRIQKSEMFGGLKEPSALGVKISVTEDGNRYELDNLYEVNVLLVNRGNVDRERFEFGITLPADQKAVLLETRSPDRHHTISAAQQVSPERGASELDFTLHPFNRSDRYAFTLYIATEGETSEIGHLEFSSPSSAAFVSLPTVGEMLAEFGSSISVGPLELTVREPRIVRRIRRLMK